MRRPENTFCGNTRREFLGSVGGGFTANALAGLLGGEGYFNRAGASPLNPLAPKMPTLPGKAKSVIFLFM